METSNSKPSPPTNPFISIPSFINQQWHRFNSDISTRIEDSKRIISNTLTSLPLQPNQSQFASLTHQQPWEPKHSFDIALSADYVAKTLAGTSVYTVSNSNNEFVLISDPNNLKSLGLLCFRQEDAETLLAQVQLKQPVLGRGARVVPITLDQTFTKPSSSACAKPISKYGNAAITLDPLVCWNCKELEHSRSNFPKPKNILLVGNDEESSQEYEDIEEEVHLKPPMKNTKEAALCILDMSFKKGFEKFAACKQVSLWTSFTQKGRFMYIVLLSGGAGAGFLTAIHLIPAFY